MRHRLGEEQRAIQETAHRFARDVIRPVAARYDADQHFPLDELKQAWELGLLCSGIPESCGGAGQSLATQSLITEELSWGCAGVAAANVTGDLGTVPIALFGTEEQKQRYLAPFADELRLCSFALSEPSGGSDIGGLKTTAERRGDVYVLNGTKQWITTAAHADFFVVFATVEPKARERGMTAFVVDRGTPGLRVGRKERTLGVRCSGTHEVVLEGCEVPAGQRIGEERQGFQVARAALVRSRVLVGCMGIGIARAALEHAVAYSLERKINKAHLATYQAIQLKLADMAADVHASRLLVHDAAERLDQGLSAEKEAAMAKIFSADAAMRCATEAVQILGGYGTTRDYPVEKLFRDAKMLQVIEGTNEVLRLLTATEIITETLRKH